MYELKKKKIKNSAKDLRSERFWITKCHNYFLTNGLKYILTCIKQSPLDQVWLYFERTLCKEIQTPDMSFIILIMRQHSCFNSVNVSTSLGNKSSKTINFTALYEKGYDIFPFNELIGLYSLNTKKKILKHFQVKYIIKSMFDLSHWIQSYLQ